MANTGNQAGTPYELYHELTPGQVGYLLAKTMRHPIQEGAGAGIAAFRVGQMFNKNTFPEIFGGRGYNANLWTVTTTGTAAAVADNAAQGGGVLSTCGSTSTFNTNLESKQPWAPVAGKQIALLARVACSDVVAAGFSIGFGNSNVDPFTADYTDQIAIRKAVGAGTVVGRARGDSGAAANSGTLGTMVNATEVELGIWASLDPAASAGFFTYNGVITPFTANQLAQLNAILTTPPNMFLNLYAKGSAGNPTVSWISVLAEIDT